MTADEFLSLSRYFILTGIFLCLINLVICSYHIFVHRSVIVKGSGARLAFSFVILAFLCLVCLFSIFAYRDESLTAWFGTSIFVLSVISLFAVGWNFSQLKGMQERVIELLESVVGVLEAGDQNLDGHSLHVKELSMLIYDNLSLRQKLSINPYNLQYAALLIDIGKLGIPREIIDKTGKLAPEEWELMRRHPEIGVKILEPIESFDTILDWIKYHHERVDGTGYYHLTRKEIPLASRILAVADTYSAITMPRSYKAFHPYEEAIYELKFVSGTQLDPEIVQLLCMIPKSKVESCMADVHKKMERYQIGTFR